MSSSMHSGDSQLRFNLVFSSSFCAAPPPSAWQSCGQGLTHFSMGPVVESKPGVQLLHSVLTCFLGADLSTSPPFGRSPLLSGDLTVPQVLCCATPAAFPDYARCHLICPRLPRGKPLLVLTREEPDIASVGCQPPASHACGCLIEFS